MSSSSRPAHRLSTHSTLEPSVQQIGVAAAFRDIRSANWRVIVPVSQAPKGRGRSNCKSARSARRSPPGSRPGGRCGGSEEMTINNKVVWTEGLFLRPQHFQQQDRYVERYVELRASALRATAGASRELEIERDLLAIGKVALRRARGRVSRRHAVPHAGRRPVAAGRSTLRRRRAIRSSIWRCRCAGPARSRSTRRAARAEITPSAAPGTARCATTAALTDEPALLEVAALKPRLLLAATNRWTRTPACRSRTSSSAGPTGRSCSTTGSSRPSCVVARRRGSIVHARARRAAAPARRSARRPRGGDRAGRERRRSPTS